MSMIVPEVAHVRRPIVMPMRRGGRERPSVGDPGHAIETMFHQLVRPRPDPAGHVGVGGAAVRRIVLEATVVRRVVRWRDDDAVGHPAGSSAVVADDGVRHHRRRRVFVVFRQHDIDAVGRQHLDRGGTGRERQRVRVDTEKERAVDALAPAVATDGLADGGDMPFVERGVERRTPVPRGAERHPLGGHRGVRDSGVVGGDQPAHVEEHRRWRRMTGEGTDVHGFPAERSWRERTSTRPSG